MLFGGESVVFGVGSAQSLRFLLETNQRQSILLLWSSLHRKISILIYFLWFEHKLWFLGLGLPKVSAFYWRAGESRIGG